MTEPKFTKGPWKAKYDSQLRVAIEIYSVEDTILIAGLPDRGTIDMCAETEANAHLIAAAPDMYEALEDLCKKCEERRNCYDECIIYKALRKARGEAE